MLRSGDQCSCIRATNALTLVLICLGANHLYYTGKGRVTVLNGITIPLHSPFARNTASDQGIAYRASRKKYCLLCSRNLRSIAASPKCQHPTTTFPADQYIQKNLVRPQVSASGAYGDCYLRNSYGWDNQLGPFNKIHLCTTYLDQRKAHPLFHVAAILKLERNEVSASSANCGRHLCNDKVDVFCLEYRGPREEPTQVASRASRAVLSPGYIPDGASQHCGSDDCTSPKKTLSFIGVGEGSAAEENNKEPQYNREEATVVSVSSPLPTQATDCYSPESNKQCSINRFWVMEYNHPKNEAKKARECSYEPQKKFQH